MTRLSSEGIGSDFGLIVDNGCLHGISPEDRDAYVREVTAVAAPDARLLLVEFMTGGSYGVPGIDPDEVKQRFAADWTLLSSGDEPSTGSQRQEPGAPLLVCARRVERGDVGQTHLQRWVARQFVDNGEGDRHVVHGQ